MNCPLPNYLSVFKQHEIRIRKSANNNHHSAFYLHQTRTANKIFSGLIFFFLHRLLRREEIHNTHVPVIDLGKTILDGRRRKKLLFFSSNLRGGIWHLIAGKPVSRKHFLRLHRYSASCPLFFSTQREQHHFQK